MLHLDIRRWHLRYRLMALIGMIGVCMALLCGVASWLVYQSLFDAKRAELRHLAETALSVIEREHRHVAEGKLSEAEAKARALAAIGDLRYGGTEYFWINDMTPAMVMHPIKPALDGEDLSSFADANGKHLFVAFVDVVRESGAGFVSYAWPRPHGDEPVAKESYVIGFAPWGWIVGTGVYVDDLVGATWQVAKSLIQMSIVILLAAGGVALWLSSTITRPLAALTDLANRLADGEHVRVAASEHDNEIGAFTRAFQVFAARGLEAARLRAALDSCQTNVMVANRSLQIVYVNPNLQRLLKAVEDDIRRKFPDFSVDALLGAHIDVFHAMPERQRAILADLDATRNADIELGGRTISLAVSPVLSEGGERLGTVVEWQDRTAELTTLKEIDQVVVAACHGDLGRRLQLEGKRGFMFDLAKSINRLTSVVDEVTEDVGATLEGLARGDLSRAITADYQGRFGKLKRSVNDMVHQLTAIVSDVQTAVEEVGAAASEIAGGTEDLSARTEEAASNLEETAASTEQMSASVRQNAENAKNADRLAEVANQTASDGGRVVERAVGAMSGIESAAEKITDIIGVIDEIAFQTNLLALNASVEAARAGEAGKGFAVVAQEVRKLAQRSARAASDIKTLIQDSNGQVTEGVRLVNQAGEALEKILESVGKVTEIVRDIASASQEQAAGIQEIDSSITNMDEMTQQNSALVEQSTAAARALSDQSIRLGELIAFFKLEGRNRPGGSSATASAHPPALQAIRARSKDEAAKLPRALTDGDQGWSAS